MRILFLAFLLTLVACAGPQNTGDMKAAGPPPMMSNEKTATPPAQNVVIEEKTTDSKPGEVDFSCKTASDCKIKDVGSCCGYRPACVNKDSQTYPEQVKAECAKKGMAGICGFPSISSCTCTNNKCEGVAGGSGEAELQ
ncbi:MAG: hypothetical protein ACREPB_14955 [Arenimonas sp.]